DILLRLRGALSTLWNSFVLFDTYVDKVPPSLKLRRAGKSQKSKVKNANVLDQWVMVKLDALIAAVTVRLDDYDIVGAARLLDTFIGEDFSNWYLRRSRRRFQRPAAEGEKGEAAAVTATVLLRLAELMAPFTPFLAEIIYRELRPKLGLDEESVHLRDWPVVRLKAKSQRPKPLLDGMVEVRRLAALALAERAKAGIKVRQPLQKLKVKSERLKVSGLLNVLREEVNVREVVVDTDMSDEVVLDTAITEELREEGLIRELIRNIQELRRDAGMKPGDGVRVRVAGDADLVSLVERWSALIRQEAGAREVLAGGTWVAAASRDVDLGGKRVRLGIRRV
ncbi:MAG: class I tRNA ligase family protein, partial [bacterium]|nr:class I tRNA ligase family protein [bacterium]